MDDTGHHSITCSTIRAQEYDVVVVGSGAAGMTAALTAAHQGLSALVIVEKAAHYGGSTARSGGGVWIPNNEALQARRGHRHPGRPRASTCTASSATSSPPRPRIDTYLDRGPEMLSFVLKNSALELQWVPGYSDYYPEAPGGRVGGRSVPSPRRSTVNKLSATTRKNLESPTTSRLHKNFVITQADYKWLNLLMRNRRSAPCAAMKVGMRFLAAKATTPGKGPAGPRAGPGRRHADRPARPAGVPILLNTPLTELYTEDGAVPGAREGARRRRGAGHPRPSRGPAGRRRVRAQRRVAQQVPARADRHRVVLRRRPTPVTRSAPV